MKIFPVFDKKFVVTWVLILSIIAQMMPIIGMVAEVVYDRAVWPRILKETYIAEIKGDPTEKAIIKDALDYFNNMADGKIIRYDKSESYFARPVTLEMHDFEKDLFFNNLDGLTFVKSDSCKIQVRPTSNPVEFKQVLIHEYLHCMGYDHIDNPEDVMYPSYSEVKEENLKKYAEELKKKLE